MQPPPLVPIITRSSSTSTGLNIGRDGSGNVTDDYPGGLPWAFTGGTISRVIVDVSGEAYADLETEAAGVMMRD